MPNSFHLSRWIAIISHYSRKGFYEETIGLFRQMQNEGLPPNRIILPSVLRSASKIFDSRTGRSLHSLSIRSFLSSDPFVSSALIEFYSKCGRIKNARQVFDVTPEKDLVVWNSIVSGYASHGLLEEERLLLCFNKWWRSPKFGRAQPPLAVYYRLQPTC
ncbi:hypothetical protein M5K25_002472 [Dendrobium thyrsiflorum]|uniref:Pentatricopeptide repeat-containing protein n=1 Tax=Dendrobium thyrsiflorum TaxID=117978 RepID=A0ABD0VNN3_DENTH